MRHFGISIKSFTYKKKNFISVYFLSFLLICSLHEAVHATVLSFFPPHAAEFRFDDLFLVMEMDNALIDDRGTLLLFFQLC